MNAYFGLDSFAIDVIEAGPRSVRCEVSLATRPLCPKCGDGANLTLHGWTKPFRIHDTPSRGLPTTLEVRRRRWRCEKCPGRPTFSERGPDVHDEWKATRRLVSYVENEVTKHPLSVVAKATGLPETTVRNMALDLSARLEKHHRFPTPTTLAVDALKFKDVYYNVFADAWTGLALGIVESSRVGPARGWIAQFNQPDHIDPSRVEFFVSDMHTTNISLARRPLGHALHIADKWHVIRRFQEPFGGVISQEIDRLRKSSDPEAQALGRELWHLKPALLAVDPRRRRSRRRRGHPQMAIAFDDLLNVFRKVPRVRRAFWARYELIPFYRSTNLADARKRMTLFLNRIAEFQGTAGMASFLDHLTAHDTAIFNYFLAVRPRGGGRYRGPTTNALEQRNSSIRQIWRSGRGIRSLALLRLRTVYAPWHIGAEIVRCSHDGCPTFVGPLVGIGRVAGPRTPGLPLCPVHTA